MVTSKRYEGMCDLYEKRIENLEHDVKYWRDRYTELAAHNPRTELDIYKSILAKQGILGEPNKYSDKTFIFEGKIYRPISYHLDIEPDRMDELIVDFVRVKEE